MLMNPELFMTLYSALVVAFPATIIPPLTAKVFFAALCDIPDEQLAGAVAEWLAHGKRFPYISDLRESPSIDLVRLLQDKGADVSYHDPLVASMEVDGLSMKSVDLDERTLREADCVVVATAHSSYDWGWIVRNCSLVVDTRNATRGAAADRARIVRL